MEVQNLAAQVEVGLLDLSELLKFGNAKIEPKFGGNELDVLLFGLFGDRDDAIDLAEIFVFGLLGFARRPFEAFLLNFFQFLGVIRNLFTNAAFV